MMNAEQILGMNNQPMLVVDESTKIEDALKKMTIRNCGAVLIEKKGHIVGIWTERDLMANVQNEKFKLKDKISKYVSVDLITVQLYENAYSLMDKMLGKRKRHLLVERDGEIIGILSVGDVLRAVMLDKFSEYQKENKEVSWNYYEDWKWDEMKVEPVEQSLRVELR